MSGASEAAPILVTVGTQLPFPRLVDAMDRLAPGLERPVIAQTGPWDGVGEPAARWPNLHVEPFIGSAAFAALAARAHLIVGHAGIGTLLSARAHGRPAILVPRRAALSEHRNEHQLATARRLNGRAGVAIAWEVEDLPGLLADPPQAPDGSAGASPELAALRARLRRFIEEG